MNLLIAVVVGTVFGSGVQTMVRNDVVKLAAGTLLITNAAVLFLVSAGFGQHTVPVLPTENIEDVADPLVQALALTAAVIGFGSTVLLLRIGLGVARSHDTIEVEALVKAELAEDDIQPAETRELD